MKECINNERRKEEWQKDERVVYLRMSYDVIHRSTPRCMVYHGKVTPLTPSNDIYGLKPKNNNITQLGYHMLTTNNMRLCQMHYYYIL